MSALERLLADDQAGRRAAQTHFDGTLVLEAGAGTGKTTTLVARVLSWSLSRGWDAAREAHQDLTDERLAQRVLQGVVAITFTEAGAAEMATRVAAALARLASGEGGELVGFDPELLEVDEPRGLAERARHLLGALDHLTVETIHAFCRRLLAAYPLDAGIHPDLQVDPELRLTEEIAFEVVDEAVRRAYARPRGQALADLAALGIGPDALVRVLRRLRESGLAARALAVDPFTEEGVRAVVDRLRAAFEDFVQAGGSALRRVSRGKAPEVAAAVDQSRERLDSSIASLTELDELAESLGPLWENHYQKLGDWQKGRFSQSEKGALADHLSTFPEAAGELRGLLRHLGRMQPRMLDVARRALAPLLKECERRGAARGVATFSDLLSGAHHLLATRRAVRRRQRRRIQQLLVDEFQDTDSLQCEIIRLLALSGPREERPGLFLVGDPKQSIFGWREADLAAYEAFVSAALDEEGERHHLARNFRSDPAVLDEVTKVVEPLMIETPGLQPPFVELIPHRDSRLDSAQWRPIEYWVSWPPEDGATGRAGSGTLDATAALEAKSIAADARAIHDELGTPWSEIALIFRSTNRLDTYLSALRDAGVPFIVTRDKQYYRRKEIIDAASLVRAVVDPLDHISLVAFLRSAMVGVPDAALLPLWQHEFPNRVSGIRGPASQALQQALDAVELATGSMPGDIPGLDRVVGWPARLRDALETLAALRQSFRRDDVARFIDQLRERSLIEIYEAARYQGKFRIANLDRFFRLLEESLTAHGNDMRSILRVLRRSLDEAPDAKEAPPKDAGEDAVQVLTIHKAKGLEFDHVYLPQMHGLNPARDDLPEVDIDRRWRQSDEPQYCLFQAATPWWSDVVQRSSTVEAMESVRLLYVALTRARQRVVLLGSWPRALKPVAPARARSPLDLVNSRQGLDRGPQELEEECQAGDRSWIDHEEIRWRFLRHQEAAPGDDPRAAPETWVPTPSVTAEQQAVAAAHHATAQEIMVRPRHAAASAAAGAKLEALTQTQEPGGPRTSLPVSRDTALVVGTAMHRLFEDWQLDAQPEAELARLRRQTLARLEQWLDDGAVAAATELAGELIDRFSGGTLWRRWLEIADRIVARELPVITPASPDGPALHALVGSVDLVYRDPADDRLVVADFKTDRVEDEDALTARAEVYASQEEVYVDALMRGLDLEEPPHAELWFLWPDRMWRSS